MKSQILAIINNEDKHCPFTDEYIAKKLKLRREQITLLRREFGISDSRERLKENILKDINGHQDKLSGLSERGIKEFMNELGYDVSRHIVRELKNAMASQPVNQSVKKVQSESLKPRAEEYNPFERLVGYDKSLVPIIKQAKAAMMYPPRGLHTLILGETGVGKSDLASAMFDFAKKSNVLDRNSKLITFNCADYAENPELLMSQIFGYKKGAYTGADTDKEGLVEKANNSILFLDEIHRLPPEGQEQLFYLIDKGRFRRLGETNQERKADLTIIAATTENPELTLLKTFRRRIPMVIEIPSLNARPVTERFEIIKKFVLQESIRINKPIVLKNEVVRSLLLFDCPGNLGQLKSEIQVACARSFLNMMINDMDQLEINVEDLSTLAKRGLMQLKYYRSDIEAITGNHELVVNPFGQSEKSSDNGLYAWQDEIYSFIENRYSELQNKYINNEIINYILGTEIEKKLKKYFQKLEYNKVKLNKDDLKNIFGEEIIGVVEKAIAIASHKYTKNMDSLYYILAAHLSTTVERLKNGKIITNPQLHTIQKEYPEEFEVALEIVGCVEETLELKVPLDEAGFIAMYLRMTLDGVKDEEEGNVGVIVLSHGHVASGMASVANSLLGVNHARYVEMALDEKPQSALEKTLELVKKSDLGKGVLLLVDMGSLVTFGDIITEKTGIKTRTIPRTDTLLVIEAVRRAILANANLAEIADSLLESNKYVNVYKKPDEENQKLKKVIITVCITGHGGAIKIKDMLENIILEKYSDLSIIPVGIIDKKLNETIRNIQRNNQVIAIVGSIDPKVQDIPYISLDNLFNRNGLIALDEIINDKQKAEQDICDQMQQKSLKDLIFLDNIYLDQNLQTKEECIEFLTDELCRKCFVTEKYKTSVYDREEIAVTYFKDGIAIPHGMPDHIIRPTIALMKLKKTIDWDGKNVDIVSMMAVDSGCLEAIGEFYDVFDGTKSAVLLRNAVEKTEIYDILLKP